MWEVVLKGQSDQVIHKWDASKTGVPACEVKNGFDG